jgi:membrane-bound metal-dependent hydrolase YbcI (DUF457 family)
MPLTPLHFGLLAPVNYFAKDKVSNVSFILANVWMDTKSIAFVLTGYGAISHSDHELWWALVMACIIGVFRWNRAWWIGAFLGSTSHVLLDSFVHADVQPFAPWIAGNPLFLSLMEPLSLVLLALCAWLTAQYVSKIRETLETNLAAVKAALAKRGL